MNLQFWCLFEKYDIGVRTLGPVFPKAFLQTALNLLHIIYFYMIFISFSSEISLAIVIQTTKNKCYLDFEMKLEFFAFRKKKYSLKFIFSGLFSENLLFLEKNRPN